MNIGFVGVGRMGAEHGAPFEGSTVSTITAIYDIRPRESYIYLLPRLVARPRQDLSEVTAASDVIFTVVTDDNAVRQIFTGAGDNLLINARGKLFINCETISAGGGDRY